MERYAYSPLSIHILPEALNVAMTGAEILRKADQGNADCQNTAGKMYRDGIDVEQSDDRAVFYFLRCEEKNPHNKEATANLHALFLQGRGTHFNEEARARALAYLTTTAEGNSTDAPQAKYQLGKLLANTYCEKAAALFIEAIEAQVPDALNQLADLLCTDGPARDSLPPLTSAEYLKKAADELQHPGAAFEYAEICANDDESFWGKSPQETALPYYQIAANAGNKSALFKCFDYLANEVLKNENSWVAQVENVHGIALSNLIADQEKMGNDAYQVGYAYLYGDNKIGVKKDLIKAEKFLAIAVKYQHPEANLKHGLAAYLADDSTYGKYHRIAVKAGFLPAVLSQQLFNLKGFGKSAEISYQLYQLHNNGDSFLGLPRDVRKAHFFLNLSATYGYSEAKQKIFGELKPIGDASPKPVEEVKNSNQKLTGDEEFTARKMNEIARLRTNATPLEEIAITSLKGVATVSTMIDEMSVAYLKGVATVFSIDIKPLLLMRNRESHKTIDDMVLNDYVKFFSDKTNPAELTSAKQKNPVKTSKIKSEAPSIDDQKIGSEKSDKKSESIIELSSGQGAQEKQKNSNRTNSEPIAPIAKGDIRSKAIVPSDPVWFDDIENSGL